MKILLVNCYHVEKPFLRFQRLVYQLFKEESHLVDTEIEFFVRNPSNLDDLLYEINSNYTKKEAAKNFDVLDMVFIIGDPIIKPW